MPAGSQAVTRPLMLRLLEPMAAGQLAGERRPGLGRTTFSRHFMSPHPRARIPSDWTFQGAGEPGGKVGPGRELVCGFRVLVTPKPHTGPTLGTGSPGMASKAQDSSPLAPGRGLS